MQFTKHIFQYAGIALLLIAVYACPAKKDGAIQGTILPPGSGARITVAKDAKTVTTVDAGAQDGVFSIALAPGTYDISVTSPASPFPLNFPGIVVKPGETTNIPPIQLAPVKSTAVLSGRITPAIDTHITLLYEGKERAAARTNAQGRFEFEGLPTGRYTIQANSPGYANDTMEISLADNQTLSQNMRLLYISAIDGVDWAGGTVRARGVGLPPRNAPTPSVRREMTKRAALADGQRNLLRTIEQIKVGPSQNLTSLLGEGKYVQTLQGYVQGYRVVSERDMDGGRIEVELELPLTGANGLSSYIREK